MSNVIGSRLSGHTPKTPAELANCFRAVVLGADEYGRRNNTFALVDYRLAESGVTPVRFTSLRSVRSALHDLQNASDRLGDSVHPLLRSNIQAAVTLLNLPKSSTWEHFEHTYRLYGVWPKQLSLDAMAASYMTARGKFHVAYPGAKYTPEGVDNARSSTKFSEDQARERILETQAKVAEILLRPNGVSPDSFEFAFDDIERLEWADTIRPGRLRLRFNPKLLMDLPPGELERVVVHGNAHILHLSRLAASLAEGKAPHDAAAELVLEYGPLTPVCEGFANTAVLFYPELQSLGPEFTEAAHAKIHAQVPWHNARVGYYAENCRFDGQRWLPPEGKPPADLLAIVDKNFTLWTPSAKQAPIRTQSFRRRMADPSLALKYFVPYELGAVIMRPLALRDELSNAMLRERLLSDPTLTIASLDGLLEEYRPFVNRYWTDPLPLAVYEPPGPATRWTSMSPYPPDAHGVWPTAGKFHHTHFPSSSLDDMGETLNRIVEKAGNDDRLLERLLAVETFGPWAIALAGRERNDTVPPLQPALGQRGIRLRQQFREDHEPPLLEAGRQIAAMNVERRDGSLGTDSLGLR